MVYADRMVMIARVLVSILMVVSLVDTAGNAAPRIRMTDTSPVGRIAALDACVPAAAERSQVEKRTCRHGGNPALIVPCPEIPGMLSQSADQSARLCGGTQIAFRATPKRDIIPDRILDPPRLPFVA